MHLSMLSRIFFISTPQNIPFEVASAPIHAFLTFDLPVLQTILFASHLLLSHKPSSKPVFFFFSSLQEQIESLKKNFDMKIVNAKDLKRCFKNRVR